GRRKRAREALARVGLGDQIHKRPGQLSGGQMQRVAIARALLNNPDILLADEPTGALDSETSIQVMDLLKEVAQDRLVVMVTHNPELAEQYATRIVRIRDGKVTDDTDPFDPAKELPAGAYVPRKVRKKKKKRKKQASMSFMTALLLSFNNLLTKKARTILVAIAGSIGIIGIALIQSLSNGVNDYIDSIEENTVLQYPITMNTTGINMAAYMEAFADLQENEKTDRDTVTVNQIMRKFASGLTRNDLRSADEYLINHTDIMDYAKAIEYSYSIEPQIYAVYEGKLRRIHPDESIDNTGMSVSSLESFGMTAMFQLPENKILYEDSYELKSGRWPENKNELILVVGSDGTITDIVAYALGLRESKEFDELMQALMYGKAVPEVGNMGEYSYDEIMSKTFRAIPGYKLYQYDEDNKLWVKKASNETYMRKLYRDTEEMRIVGVVKQRPNAESVLNPGIYYQPSLVLSLIDDAANSEIVKQQMADRDINVLTGKEFGTSTGLEDFDLSALFSVDEEAITKMFSFDEESFDFESMDLSGIDISGIDLSGLDFSGIDISGLDFTAIDLSGIDLSSVDFSSLGLDDLDVSDVIDLSDISSYLPEMTDEERAALIGSVQVNITPEDFNTLISTIIGGYLSTIDTSQFLSLTDIQTKISEYLQSDESLQAIVQLVVDSVNNLIANGITDPAEFADNITVTAEQLAALSSTLASGLITYISDELTPDFSGIALGFAGYLLTDDVQTVIQTFADEHIDTSVLQEYVSGVITSVQQQIQADISAKVSGAAAAVVSSMAQQAGTAVSNAISSGLSTAMASALETVGTQIVSVMESGLQTALQSAMETILGSITEQMANAFTFDEEALKEAFGLNMSEESAQDVLTSMISEASVTYDSNMLAFGYADPKQPETISIYSKDFDSKAVIIGILSDYNEMRKANGEEEKIITYSDLAGTMMSSVSSVINVVSAVLMALVAISLIVSSIMIGVITYISVLERKKEIGILRALGASKGNVAQVFNAETFITGLLAGLLGVIASMLLLLPVNWAIVTFAGREDISAYLDPRAAVLLVILSVVLNIIAGFLPSRKASKSNPVTALRDE
ncbi:MAG: FtsX-like permease family protein, partial [Lachnospiraceae bacterium]|nr:FtsX-like permease family protein [Lachnospiraceae bacterium]